MPGNVHNDDLLDYEEAYELALSPQKTMTVLLPKDLIDDAEVETETIPTSRQHRGTVVFSRNVMRYRQILGLKRAKR